MHLIFQFPLLPILWLILGKEIFVFLFHNKQLLAESLMLQYFCVLFPGRCLRSDVISDDMMILGLKWAPRVTGDSWHLISNKLHSLLSPNKAICPLIGQQCSLWNTFWPFYFTTCQTHNRTSQPLLLWENDSDRHVVGLPPNVFFWGRKFVRLFVYLRRVCWVEWGTSGQVFPLDNLPWYFKGFPIPFLIFIQLITLSWFIKTPRDILKGFSSLSHLHPIDDLVWSRIWS